MANNPNDKSLSLTEETAAACLYGYLNTMSSEYHRFRSWEFCYHKFKRVRKCFGLHCRIDELALNLGFYLASFGMMARRAFLLNANYKIHEDIVRCLFKKWSVVKKLRKLAQNPSLFNDNDEYWERISDLRESFDNKYSKHIKNGKKKPMTDTLFTKILMGTLGCTVAYDRYLTRGLKAIGGTGSFGKRSMLEICKYYDQYDEIIRNYNKIKSAHKLNALYPPMRVLDMILWQYGCELCGVEETIESKCGFSPSVTNFNVEINDGRPVLSFSLSVDMSLGLDEFKDKIKDDYNLI